MKRITVFYLVYCFITLNSNVFAQTSLELSEDQNEQEVYNNIHYEEVHFLPGYTFLTGLPGMFDNPKMNGRIDFSIIGPAQSGDVLSEDDIDSSIDTSKPVINLSGSTSVSASGAAIYSLPISIPKGTAGMQPTVSVNYNSQIGSGLLGQGWNLSAVSAISRVPKIYIMMMRFGEFN